MRKIKLEALIEAQRKYLEYLEFQLSLEQPEPKRRETRRKARIERASFIQEINTKRFSKYRHTSDKAWLHY